MDELERKLGPFPVWAWAVIFVGAYLLYKHLHGSTSSNSQAAIEQAMLNGEALAGASGSANNAPSGTSGSGSISLGSTPTPSALEQWITDAQNYFTQLGITGGNGALAAFTAGQPLSQAQYDLIESATKVLGGAPGLSGPIAPTAPTSTPTTAPTSTPTTTPTTTPSTTSTPIEPSLPVNLVNAMQANGQHIVSSAFDKVTNTWYYLENNGGVYAITPNGQNSGYYMGSYMDLPASGRMVPAGAPQRTFNQIAINNDGSYTLTSTGGQTYTFNPSTRKQLQQTGYS